MLAVDSSGPARLFEKLMPDEERRPQRAAGVARGRLDPEVFEGPSRSSRPLATQLSATPPARTRCFMPVCAMDVAAEPQHRFFGDGLNAGRQVHVPLFEWRLRRPRRPAEELVEPALVIVSPWQ